MPSVTEFTVSVAILVAVCTYLMAALVVACVRAEREPWPMAILIGAFWLPMMVFTSLWELGEKLWASRRITSR